MERGEECYPATQLTMKTCSPVHPADISKVAKLISYLTNSSAHSLTSQYFKSRGVQYTVYFIVQVWYILLLISIGVITAFFGGIFWERQGFWVIFYLWPYQEQSISIKLISYKNQPASGRLKDKNIELKIQIGQFSFKEKVTHFVGNLTEIIDLYCIYFKSFRDHNII